MMSATTQRVKLMRGRVVNLSVIAICLGYSIALIPGNTSPLIVGGLIAGLGLGLTETGMVLSCELILMGIAATALATRMASINSRSACFAGAGLLLVGHGLAATATSMEQILIYRSFAGVGAGIVLAAVNATIAGAANPTRLYGLTMMAPPVIGFVVAFAMSRGISAFAHAGAYGVLALLSLIVLPFLVAFPDYRKKNHSTEPDALKEYAPGIALLLMIFIMGVTMMAYFAFVERLGVRLNLSIEEIGNIFAWVVLGGAFGAGIAAMLENRFGLMKPLIVGILLHSAAMIIAIKIISLPAYIIGTVLEGITLVYTLTFLFAIAASLDHHGRWAAAAGGAFSLSLGVGPYLGGAIIELFGFGALTILITISTLTILSLLWWIAFNVRSDNK
jgi:predicted MFS family arabinose efflux permease